MKIKVFRTKLGWLKAKKDLISGTDAGVIMGVNPWKTNVELWYEKKEKAKITPPNEYMVRGLRAEKIMIDLYELDHPKECFVRQVENSLYVSDAIDWLSGSFDGVALDGKSFIEIKTAKVYDDEQDLSSERFGFVKTWQRGLAVSVPKYYSYQVAHYFLVNPEFHTGKLRAYVARYSNKFQKTPYTYEVLDYYYERVGKDFITGFPLDKSTAQEFRCDLVELLTKETNFHDCLVNNVKPKRIINK